MSTMTKATIEIIDGPDYGRDADQWEHNAYRLRVHYDGRSIEVPWRQGLGITDDPDAESVMESLASDAAGFVNARGFEDWADEYGYDSDSRKAYAIYQAVDGQTEQLRDLLGEDFEGVVFPTD